MLQCCSVLQCVATVCLEVDTTTRPASSSTVICGMAGGILSCAPCGARQLFDVGTVQLHRVCCSVLQCVAVCCSVLQCVAVCCSVGTVQLHTPLDGYCSTLQGLLDWFEVDLGFTELLFIQTKACVLCVFVFYSFSFSSSHVT